MSELAILMYSEASMSEREARDETERSSLPDIFMFVRMRERERSISLEGTDSDACEVCFDGDGEALESECLSVDSEEG